MRFVIIPKIPENLSRLKELLEELGVEIVPLSELDLWDKINLELFFEQKGRGVLIEEKPEKIKKLKKQIFSRIGKTTIFPEASLPETDPYLLE